MPKAKHNIRTRGRTLTCALYGLKESVNVSLASAFCSSSSLSLLLSLKSSEGLNVFSRENSRRLHDVLLHHDAAAELLLLCSQTQLLHVRVCAGDRAQVPHGRLGHDGESALCCRVGLLLEVSVGVRVGLLADVQTSLEKVSSGGHGRQGRGVAGRGG